MKTPGIYTDINTQTQRTGLPTQNHSIVFVTGDLGAPTNPTSIYDTATADAVSGANSNAGRMMAAALSISQGVDVETVGKSESSGDGGAAKPSFIEVNRYGADGVDANVSNSQSLGLVYRIDDGELQFASVAAGMGGGSTMFLNGTFFREGDFGKSLIEGFSASNEHMIYGLSTEMSAFWDYLSIANSIVKKQSVTFYPKSALATAVFDVDVFDYIIAPNVAAADATTAPYLDAATVNSDGSYTIHSLIQMTVNPPPVGGDDP